MVNRGKTRKLGGDSDSGLPGIRVLVRVRPRLSQESSDERTRMEVDEAKRCIRVKSSVSSATGMTSPRPLTRWHSFGFDSVVGTNASQEDMWHAAKVEKMIEMVVKGYNATIFAYGQTTSGKTYTMDGLNERSRPNTLDSQTESESPIDGIIPRAIRHLFKLIGDEASKQRTFKVSCSFCQIYQENVYDLLSPLPATMNWSGQHKQRLRIRWERDQKFFVENMFSYECRSAEDALRHLLRGISHRIVASHRMNVRSSRSHCIFKLTVKQIDPEHLNSTTSSELTLVDLAGSERQSLTNASGRTFSESIGINKSLLVLRKVIRILGNHGKRSSGKVHIPYRDSSLTKLLACSLGGSCLTLMIACIADSEKFIDENLSTLRYASMASKIENRPSLCTDPQSKLIARLRGQVTFLKQQLARATQVYHTEDGGIIEPIQISQTYSSGRTANEQHPPHDASYNRFKTRTKNAVCDRELSEKFIDSVNMIKELRQDNNYLRSSFDQWNSDFESSSFKNFVLNRENEELRERNQFLESVIVGETPESASKDVRVNSLTGPSLPIKSRESSSKDKQSDHRSLRASSEDPSISQFSRTRLLSVLERAQRENHLLRHRMRDALRYLDQARLGERYPDQARLGERYSDQAQVSEVGETSRRERSSAVLPPTKLEILESSYKLFPNSQQDRCRTRERKIRTVPSNFLGIRPPAISVPRRNTLPKSFRVSDANIPIRNSARAFGDYENVSGFGLRRNSDEADSTKNQLWKSGALLEYDKESGELDQLASFSPKRKHGGHAFTSPLLPKTTQFVRQNKSAVPHPPKLPKNTEFEVSPRRNSTCRLVDSRFQSSRQLENLVKASRQRTKSLEDSILS
eukprot:815847_1